MCRVPSVLPARYDLYSLRESAPRALGYDRGQLGVESSKALVRVLGREDDSESCEKELLPYFLPPPRRNLATLNVVVSEAREAPPRMATWR